MAKIFLDDIPLEEARNKFKQRLQAAKLWRRLGIESLDLDERLVGRILAETVWARISSPHYHASAMDGFAVKSEKTLGALETAPVSLDCSADADYLDTGDPVPEWADAVIPIENVVALDKRGNPAEDPRNPDQIQVRAAVSPWSHIREMGEDMVATQLVLAEGSQLTPFDLGAAAGCGYAALKTASKPRVGVIPTGTELIYPGDPIRAGDIIEYNSIVLASQINRWGGKATRYKNVPDDYQQIKSAVLDAAAGNDLVMLVAGSSAGSEDYSAQIVAECGELLVHGVAVRPGHPVILGVIKNDAKTTPIVGVPGYPVSAALTAEIFVKPLIDIWLGKAVDPPDEITASITRKVNSPAGDDEYLRVAVGYLGGKALAAPLSRGSGVITSLVRADGLVIIPRGIQGLQAGDPVQVRLYRSRMELKKTIFAIGSHDLTLDLLAQFLALKDRRLAPVNVGSLGGITAIRRGETHLAGSHLLDPESGEYNLAAIDEYIPDIPLRVVTMVGRTQGLFIPPGNPKGIQGLEDLRRPEVSFVNRQHGAGTRLLLDYHLGRLGIQTGQVRGYEHEEYSHLTAAAVVASGRADCALGIEAASYALELDFIPLYSERFDLLIPLEYAESALLAPLLDLLNDPGFRAAVAERPGYDVSEMGAIIR